MSRQNLSLFVAGAAVGRGGKPSAPIRRTRGRRFCSAFCATVTDVARSLHVRLDDASAAALEIVRAGEFSDSEAVRVALREAAARRRLRSAVRDEVRTLAADKRDREEMRVIREQLAQLAPPPTD